MTIERIPEPDTVMEHTDSVQAFHAADQPAVVERKRSHGIGEGGKAHHADAVVRSFLKKALDHIFGRIEAGHATVEFYEILSFH